MKSASMTHSRQLGLSMIELMIAMALSLFLLAGVVQIFIANKVNYLVQEGVSRIQENGRYAMEVLARDIRMGGYSGCLSLDNLDLLDLRVIAKSMPADFADQMRQTVDGLNDVPSANDYDAEPGTDVLIIAGASPSAVKLDGNLTAVNAQIQLDSNPDNFEANDLLFITDCRNADIFRATNVSSGSGKTTIAHASSTNTSNKLSKAYKDDAMVMRLNRNAYYIKDSGNTNTAGDPILSLYRQDVSGNEFELVEGVEDFQITYGEDTTGADRLADVYRDADNVANWNDVVSARVSLLTNSVENIGTQERAYQFEGTTTTNPGDTKLRREFTSTMTIRNRVP